MPGYVEKALQRFTHSKPAKHQHVPSKWIAPEYEAKIQYAAPDDNSLPLDSEGITLIQQIVETFLFYARAVDLTMHVVLGTIALPKPKAQPTSWMQPSTYSIMQHPIQMLPFDFTKVTLSFMTTEMPPTLQ